MMIETTLSFEAEAVSRGRPLATPPSSTVRCCWSTPAGLVLSSCRLVLHLAHARHDTGHVHVNRTCSALVRWGCSCRGRSCNASIWPPTSRFWPGQPVHQRNNLVCVHLYMCLGGTGVGRGNPRRVKQLYSQKSDCVTRCQGVCVESHPERLMTSLGGARTRLGQTARRRAGGSIDASRRK